MQDQTLRDQMLALAVALTEQYLSDADVDAFAVKLQRLSPDPDILHHLFHSDMGVEAAVDMALAYQPIRL